MCRPRVGFLRRFGLKTGTHFAYSGLESGMEFPGVPPRVLNIDWGSAGLQEHSVYSLTMKYSA